MGIKCGAIVVIAVLVAVILAGPITGGYLLTGNSRKSSPTMIWYTRPWRQGYICERSSAGPSGR